MTIDEAIEILTQYQKGTDPLYLSKLPDAEKLGIEALKYHLYRRSTTNAVGSPLLPGETKE